ncbi:MAG TPA: phosphotransferase [Trebonia sp.]|nr:phosphotransferase [Trebonia sp.]
MGELARNGWGPVNQGWSVAGPAGQQGSSPGSPPRHVTDLTRQRLVRHGLAAAVALAERLELPGEDHVVLSNRGNLLVHFPVAGVVARVATLTAWTRREPLRWLAREIAVARHVAASDGPVVPPAQGTDPGPHWQDGFAISLSEFLAITSPSAVPTPADCGTALAEFHEAASDCPADLGFLAPATDQVTDALAVIEREALADGATVAALRAAHGRALAEIAWASGGSARMPGGQATGDQAAGGQAAGLAPVVLHGDAHAGNLLHDAHAPGRGWVWTDLEEATRGPAAWDLATLTSGYDEAGTRQALAAYAARSGMGVPAAESLVPFRRARDLEATVWLICLARLYPERYAALAVERLAALLSRQ